MKAYISDLIRESIQAMLPEEAETVLGSGVFDVSTPKSGFGDYASNAAMVLFKKFNTAPAKSPADFAQALTEKIIELDKENTFEKVESVAGFINFTLNKTVLIHNLSNIFESADNFGSSDIGANQKVLVEYFQPNMAKPLHLGHLRTAIIGDALFRILKFTGFNVESDTHLGDWGTQFGLLLLAYKKWGDIEVIKTNPIEELNKLYVRINAEIEANPELREEGKLEFVKLEQGDSEVVKLWQQFKDWSWEEYNIIYDGLGVRKSDNDWPESFFADKMPAVLQILKDKGLWKESQGAQIVDLEDYKMGVAVLIKSDGGTTYLLRDLATYIYRKEQGFDKQIYVVDNRQSHTLNQTFKILELLGVIESPNEALHIAYGFLSLPEGAMSTRKGTIIGANELITKAQEKALAIVEEKNPDLENKEVVSKIVMQSAIKYFDLSHNYKTDLVFTWDKALSFEGNTGPYLQYTHARINGINRKYTFENKSDRLVNWTATMTNSGNEVDAAVIRKLSKFSETVELVASQYAPNLLCNYLFELSQIFNSFYEANPVINAETADLKDLRFGIAKATAQVLKNGLNLLGIEAPEEM